MLSVVIATHDSERALLPTLAALVAGAAAGIVREVIVADAGSHDATTAIADGAGCRVLVSAQRRGARLKAAAEAARAPSAAGVWCCWGPGRSPGARKGCLTKPTKSLIMSRCSSAPPMATPPAIVFERRVGAVPHFNRLYTRRIGVLQDGFLRTPYS